ncbi:MAG: hypothetical protein OEW75_06990 [Cyclobacteriaceae bacterium]|nr:hypothetical protein [Cyclobacteriaceae bacterium]
MKEEKFRINIYVTDCHSVIESIQLTFSNDLVCWYFDDRDVELIRHGGTSDFYEIELESSKSEISEWLEQFNCFYNDPIYHFVVGRFSEDPVDYPSGYELLQEDEKDPMVVQCKKLSKEQEDALYLHHYQQMGWMDEQGQLTKAYYR